MGDRRLDARLIDTLALLAVVLGLTVGASSIAFTMPRDRVVAALGVLALFTITLVPLQFVEPEGRTAVLAALGFITFVTVARRGLPKADLLTGVLIVAYLAIAWYSTASAGDPEATPRFLIHAVVGISFYVIGAASSAPERATLLKALMIMAGVQVVYAIFEVIVRPPVLWASPVPEHLAHIGDRLPSELIVGVARAQGTFGHPLMFSFFLVIALGIALRHTWKTPSRRFWFVALILAGAVMSGSRSALVVMIAMTLFSLGSRRTAWLRGIALTVLGLAFLSLTGFFQSEIVDRFSASGSLSHRVGAFEALPRLLAQPSELVWLGHGWYAAPRLSEAGLLQLDGFVAVDNQLIATLAAVGILGVAIIIVLALRGIFTSPAATRVAVLAATAMFLVFDVLQYPITWGLYALLLGLAASREPKLAAEALSDYSRLDRVPARSSR
ncbi:MULTISPECIES: O-antigen ligase family protein [unclassified Microbacterium]|uniref:O-antigen ligase family protein n=1 Tax=unclassified Microbacterium TaxID=2609290 RepID=UPI003870455E